VQQLLQQLVLTGGMQSLPAQTTTATSAQVPSVTNSSSSGSWNSRTFPLSDHVN